MLLMISDLRMAESETLKKVKGKRSVSEINSRAERYESRCL